MSIKNEVTVIGKTNFHNQARLFGIKLDDRRRHMHIMGKTGMGKSSLLMNMAVSDIRNGYGLAFVDPHGDLAEALLDYIPADRIDDVIYFNPQDLEYPLAFNVLGDVPENQRHIVADGLVGVFKKIWADSWGPRLEYILRNAILTLLYRDDSTLLDIMRILADKDYRAQIVYGMDDPVLKSFWVNEFDAYGDKMQAEALAPIQNKVGQFTSSPLIRNIIGQKKSSFDLRQTMDSRKILIMNLSKGAVGEGGAQLLGAMMITKIQLAAMSRVNIPEEDRQDFFTYIDEFQNFSTDSFAEILSEARKYRLSLILAHQYVEQLPETVRSAVFGNVGTTVLFRIGAADAELFEKEFAPTLTIEDLVRLPKWKIYLKLMIDGVTSEPFSADTLPDPEPEPISFREQIIETSQQRYGIPKTKLLSEMTAPVTGLSPSGRSDGGSRWSDKKKSFQRQDSNKTSNEKSNPRWKQNDFSFRQERDSQSKSESNRNSQQPNVVPGKPTEKMKNDVPQDKASVVVAKRELSEPSVVHKAETAIIAPETPQIVAEVPEPRVEVLDIVSEEAVTQVRSNPIPQISPSTESSASVDPIISNRMSVAQLVTTNPQKIRIPNHSRSDGEVSQKNGSDHLVDSPAIATHQSDVSQLDPEVMAAPKLEQEDQYDENGNRIFPNPVLAKKLKEMYSRNVSPYGDVEYMIKAKVLKQMYEVKDTGSIEYPEFLDEVLGDIYEKLMPPIVPEEVEPEVVPFDK